MLSGLAYWTVNTNTMYYANPLCHNDLNHDDHQNGIYKTKTSKWFIYCSSIDLDTTLDVYHVCKMNLPVSTKSTVGNMCVDGMCNSDLFMCRAHTKDHRTHTLTENSPKKYWQNNNITYEKKPVWFPHSLTHTQHI